MSDKQKILLYMHAGSGNHGCEAIASTVIQLLKERDADTQVSLLSYRKHEDERYSLKDKCRIIGERSFKKHRLAHIAYYGYRLLTRDYCSFLRYRFKEALNQNPSLAISIGGDNYCYDTMLSDLTLSNQVFEQKGIPTVLLGCSIEPELLNRADIRSDLGRYRAIIARESITYEALKAAFSEELAPRIYLSSDSAFLLPARADELPEGLEEGNTVGINLSPISQESEAVSGMTLNAYKELIDYIIASTDYRIALIPHVIWEGNDDRTSLGMLYEYCISRGFEDRVIFVQDTDCEQLKGIISRCRFFIGARTHATIAAYSTCVPTLVVGYSVKARGIAADLFPDYDLSNLLVQVQELKDSNRIKDAFVWLRTHEEELRLHLKAIMPQYISKAYEIGDIIDRL